MAKRLGRDEFNLLLNGLLVFGLGVLVFNIYHAGAVTLSRHHGRSTGAPNVDDFQSKCLKFKPRVENARLEVLESLTAGSAAKLTYRDRLCGGESTTTLVTQDVCRIALHVQTSERSGIHFEAWFPKKWSGRFMATGNGGLGGCIDYNSIVYGTKHGFAAVGANNGHNGTSGLPFYQNSDVVADFAGRSLHTSVIAGKQLLEQFYDKPPSKSYFLGCSQGGRQGISSAEKYPSDFDGIVAGAPALDFNNLISWRASFFPKTGAIGSPNFIKPGIWAGLIHDEVMKQCDALDGVKDGIIEDPSLCKFDPRSLICRDGTDGQCLNEAQVGIVQSVFNGLKYGNGELIYPAMQPGSEKNAIERLYAGKPFSDSQDWFRYVVYSDPSWDPATFSTKDSHASAKLNPFNIRTYPSTPDLLHFYQQGGKILTYHGLQDQQITSLNTNRWYDYLLSTSSSIDDLDKWIRYFRISGMNHCGGGPGASIIGQGDTNAPFERARNVLKAIIDWVEQGVAPESIEGVKVKDGIAASRFKEEDIMFKRKHCRYPKRNIYKGSKKLPSSSHVDDWSCI